MALAQPLGAGISVHPLRAPACCISTKLVENYKHTQGHSGAEPTSHWAHLIQPEMQQLPPSVCLHVALQLFHYLSEQIGLRLVCGGLIVTRDEGPRRGKELDAVAWVAEPLCCVKRTVDPLSWSQLSRSTAPPLFLDSGAVLCWHMLSVQPHSPHRWWGGEMHWLVCFYNSWGNVQHLWDSSERISILDSCRHPGNILKNIHVLLIDFWKYCH